MVRWVWVMAVSSIAVILVVAAYAGLVIPLQGRAQGTMSSGNAVEDGQFRNQSSISYVHGFSLGPAAFCGLPNGSSGLLVHRWGMLEVENNVMLGSQSRPEFGPATVDSKSAFVAGLSSGEGGRISLLQLLGPTTVNASTRVHFALDSLDSTGQNYSSVVFVVGPVWQKTNGLYTGGYVLVLHLDALPNRSGWYEFDFSLSSLLHRLSGADVTGSTFDGPCPSSRGVALGLTSASSLYEGVFFPSPPMKVALTDVGVYDSDGGRDTMFNDLAFQFYQEGATHGTESNVPVSTYDISFPLP